MPKSLFTQPTTNWPSISKIITNIIFPNDKKFCPDYGIITPAHRQTDSSSKSTFTIPHTNILVDDHWQPTDIYISVCCICAWAHDEIIPLALRPMYQMCLLLLLSTTIHSHTFTYIQMYMGWYRLYDTHLFGIFKKHTTAESAHTLRHLCTTIFYYICMISSLVLTRFYRSTANKIKTNNFIAKLFGFSFCSTSRRLQCKTLSQTS